MRVGRCRREAAEAVSRTLKTLEGRNDLVANSFVRLHKH
jgi:hypothetical protein